MTTKIPQRALTNLGSFSGSIIPDNSTVPQAFQSLETDLIKNTEDIRAIDAQNLFQNTDFSQGDPGNILVPNDALDAVGMTYWVAQQTGLNPFVSVQRGVNADGLYTIRMINGIPSTTPHTISTGPYPFDVAPGLNFAPGIDVRAVDADSPLTRWMEGTVSAYNAVTGVLTLNITARSATGGVCANWYIGRNGYTENATPVHNVVSANVPTNSLVIPMTSTTTIERGANVEEAVGNGIAKATYVVSKTANSITLSQPTIGPITSGYQLTTYGDQGWYLYQNIAPENGGGFKHGTADARTSYLTFKVKSRHISGIASLMALGYSSLFTLGRAYADTFPVTEQEQIVTVPILGDTVGAPGTWQSGYDATDYPYLTVGVAWVSRGTNTSKNLPPQQWVNASPSTAPGFASAGAQGQTLDLATVVGAWVEISEVRFGFGPIRDYQSPTRLDTPTPVRHIRSPVNPRLLLESSRNPAQTRKSQLYLDQVGDVVVQSLSDDESTGTQLIKVSRDGGLHLPSYANGRLSISAGDVVTTPDVFTPYTPGVVASVPGSTPPTFGSISGRYLIEGSRAYVQLSFTVINIGTASGFIIIDLPVIAAQAEYALVGFDTGISGNPVFGRVIPGQAAVQLKLISAGFPAQNGSVLNLSGYYEIA
jgi:hypothetical protein